MHKLINILFGDRIYYDNMSKKYVEIIFDVDEALDEMAGGTDGEITLFDDYTVDKDGSGYSLMRGYDVHYSEDDEYRDGMLTINFDNKLNYKNCDYSLD